MGSSTGNYLGVPEIPRDFLGIFCVCVVAGESPGFPGVTKTWYFDKSLEIVFFFGDVLLDLHKK